MAAIAYADTFLKNSISNGIIDFELAGSFSRSQQILQSWNPLAKIFAGFSLGIDYLFLILYTLFFIVTAYKITENVSELWKKFLFTVSIVFFLAGLFDAFENYFLLQILTGSKQTSLPVYAAYFSRAKFFLLFLGLMYLFTAWIYRLVVKKS